MITRRALTTIVLILATVVLLVACPVPAEVQQGSSGDAVFIKITQNGISSDASEVVVNNFRPGGRAEMTYRVHNGTGAAIMPSIYIVDADVASYSRADGAVKIPYNISDWLTIPELDDVPPGSIRDYVVAIQIPKNVKNLPKKFGFQVQVAGNTGGKVQTAVGIWWLINMK